MDQLAEHRTVDVGYSTEVDRDSSVPLSTKPVQLLFESDVSFARQHLSLRNDEVDIAIVLDSKFHEAILTRLLFPCQHACFPKRVAGCGLRVAGYELRIGAFRLNVQLVADNPRPVTRNP